MNPHPPRIGVVGSSNIDLTFRMSRLPRPGETLAGQSFQLGFGGKGANQAVMAARLGARVTMVSRVGGDVFAEQTLHNYRQHASTPRMLCAMPARRPEPRQSSSRTAARTASFL